ncbi:MAG: hypothetical protein HRU15_15355 [Planctomycetes bacterium]|nr:hypothetical protein [Planctomycetota bacterium]
MALKRLSNLFKRKNKKIEVEQEEQEREAIGSMSTNFENMGSTMESIQDHLQGSNDSLDQIPALLKDQQELCKQVIVAQETNQGLLNAVQGYFEQRDKSQDLLLEHISTMNQQMRDGSQQHHDQVEKLVNNFRSGRKMLVIAIIFLCGVSFCLLALILLLALKPDIFGVDPLVPRAQPEMFEYPRAESL